MYHVFTADEEQLLQRLCVSLAMTAEPPKKTILQGMDYVVGTCARRQVEQAGHNVRITGRIRTRYEGRQANGNRCTGGSTRAIGR